MNGPPHVAFDGARRLFYGRQLRIEIRKTREDVCEQPLNPGMKLRSFVLGRQRGSDRPATLVAKDHEQRRPQMQTCILQRAGDFRRENVARDADDEQFAQPSIENPLGRHARVAATQDRRVRALRLGELGEGFSAEDGFASLAPDKSLIPIDEPLQRLIGGESSTFMVCCHGAIYCWLQDSLMLKTLPANDPRSTQGWAVLLSLSQSPKPTLHPPAQNKTGGNCTPANDRTPDTPMSRRRIMPGYQSDKGNPKANNRH